MATRSASRIGLWIIVGLLVVGLGGWFTGGVAGRVDEVAAVGGLEIDAQDYATALNAQITRIEQQTGQPMSLAQAQEFGLDRAVLGNLVTERVLDAEARRLGLSVSGARVAEAVRTNPAFEGLDGSFDRELYRETLRRSGLDEEQYESGLRDDTARTLLQAAVVGGLPEPLAYGRTLAAQANEARAATWARVAADGATAVPEPTEADLQAFYDANPDRFTAPETRAVAYAWLTPEMRAGEVEVTDEEVAAAYEERRSEFVQEERRLLERLVFPDDAAAADARARLDAGEASFEDLVAERGLTLSNVDLGDVARGDLDEAAEAVFAAEPGDVVGPLPSSLGPALFRVNAVLAADEVPLEEAAPGLRAEIAQARARDAISDIYPEIEDLLAGGATPADLAERLGLEAGEAAIGARSTDGPAAYAELREAALAAEPGGDPELVALSDGGVAVLQVLSVTPPALRPLEEVRADVLAGWQAQARREAALARAEAAAEAIAAGASFEDQGLEPQGATNVTRRTPIEGTSPEVLAAVFEMAPGEARAIPAADGALVVRLDAITPADDANEAFVAERAQVSSELSGAIAQDLYDAYASALRAGTEVAIDDRALAAVHAQFD